MIPKENRLTKEEKLLLKGMRAALNIDICGAINCRKGGCELCPMNAIATAHDSFLATLGEIAEEKDEVAEEEAPPRINTAGPGGIGAQMVKAMIAAYEKNMSK